VLVGCSDGDFRRGRRAVSASLLRSYQVEAIDGTSPGRRSERSVALAVLSLARAACHSQNRESRRADALGFPSLRPVHGLPVPPYRHCSPQSMRCCDRLAEGCHNGADPTAGDLLTIGEASWGWLGLCLLAGSLLGVCGCVRPASERLVCAGSCGCLGRAAWRDAAAAVCSSLMALACHFALLALRPRKARPKGVWCQ